MEEVSKIRKELDKTIPKSDIKRALELLRSLESIPMTLDVLQKTHIGMAVNRIRKSVDNPEIISLCRSMVKKWKKLLSSNQQNFSEPPPVSSSSNINPTPMQTEVPPTTSEVRLKCRQLLTEALKKPLPKELMTEPFLEEEILAGRIEECIYQEFKCTDMKYKNRFRSRVANLGDVKNPYLRLSVLRGDLAPEKIAKMTADEMASDELKKEREKFTKEAINDHQMTLTTGTKTSEIKCPACKKYNVTYNQVQTRSADEPMTTFCFCNECGKRWKFC